MNSAEKEEIVPKRTNARAPKSWREGVGRSERVGSNNSIVADNPAAARHDIGGTVAVIAHHSADQDRAAVVIQGVFAGRVAGVSCGIAEAQSAADAMPMTMAAVGVTAVMVTPKLMMMAVPMTLSIVLAVALTRVRPVAVTTSCIV